MENPEDTTTSPWSDSTRDLRIKSVTLTNELNSAPRNQTDPKGVMYSSDIIPRNHRCQVVSLIADNALNYDINTDTKVQDGSQAC